MKTNHIFSFLGILLMAFGLTLQALAQPTYISKTYLYGVFYRIVNIDSGYISYSTTKNFYKITYTGDTLKRKQFVGPKSGIYSTRCLCKSSDNHIIIAGTFQPDTTNNKYIFISKLNQNLDTLWVKYYFNTNPNYSIVATCHEDTIAVAFNKYMSGGYYLSTFTSNGDFIGIDYYPKPSGADYYSLADIYPVNGSKYIILLSADYSQKIFVCVVSQGIFSFFIGDSCDIGYLGGRVFNDNQGNISLITFYYYDYTSISLSAFNFGGQLLYFRRIYEDPNNLVHTTGTNAIMSNNGDFIITGSYQQEDTEEGVLIRANSYGQLKWMRRFEGGGTFGTNLAGVTETNNHFLACVGKKDYNEWLLVVDSLGCEAPGVCWVGEEEISALPQENLFEVFPNPAGEEVWVRSAAPLAGLTIYAMNGQKMPMAALSGENPMRIDTRTWPAGLYMVRATLQNGRVVTQKVMKYR